jgi:radical SAM superfamily enzyme
MSAATPFFDAPAANLVDSRPLPAWREAGLRYHSYRFFLRQKFGTQRVQKVSLDAGFTCPNVDGTVATGGCTFCDNRSFSPSRRNRLIDAAPVRRGSPDPAAQKILAQLDDGIRRLKHRYEVDRFIAYFQPATNTYAPVDRLRTLYEAALSHPKVVGLAIGTRPDCVPNEVLDLLQELTETGSGVFGEQNSSIVDNGISPKTPDPLGVPSRSDRIYISVEYGLQTIHNRSLDWMNRGHHHDATIDAIQRSRNRGFEICGHVILGLPGESHADMLATARECARLQIDAIKIHNLYAVKNTPLADQVARDEVTLMSRDDYIATLIDFLELLPPQMIVERISGDAPPDFFIGPTWCLDKPGVLLALHEEMERRDSWQGKRFGERGASAP